MQHIPEDYLGRLYPSPAIRGTRISRMEERDLDDFRLTAATAKILGEENIGVFIGGCTSLDSIVDRVREIDRNDTEARWIIVPSTRKSAAAVYQRWLDSTDVWFVDPDDVPETWHGVNVTFCLPESLAGLAPGLKEVDVAGIILLDLQCIVHRARGFNKGNFRVCHDRPQLIVDFRSSLSIGHWTPPLVILSQRPAKSVTTHSMQRAYCLEAFYFLDGKTIRCYPLPPHLAATKETAGKEYAGAFVTSA